MPQPAPQDIQDAEEKKGSQRFVTMYDSRYQRRNWAAAQPAVMVRIESDGGDGQRREAWGVRASLQLEPPRANSG